MNVSGSNSEWRKGRVLLSVYGATLNTQHPIFSLNPLHHSPPFERWERLSRCKSNTLSHNTYNEAWKNALLKATGRVTGMKWKKILQQSVLCNNRTTVDLRHTVHSSRRGYVFVQSNLNSKLLLLLFYFCFNASNMGKNNKQNHLMSRARRCTRKLSSRDVASFIAIKYASTNTGSYTVQSMVSSFVENGFT